MKPRVFRRAVVWLICIAASGQAFGQHPAEQSYSRLNTFSGFFEYSNDSSHIILGQALNRKIGAIGFQYQRRLFQREYLDFSYQAEIRPGMIESDPTRVDTLTYTSPIQQTYASAPFPVMMCVASRESFDDTVATATGPVHYVGQDVVNCDRRTVAEQGFSPGGIRINLMPRYRLQLTFSSDAGYIFSTQEVPIPRAGSFNFAFDFGGGLEFYRSRTRSIRLEYQVQHFSNKKTADLNPGVDSGFVRLTYAFGR